MKNTNIAPDKNQTIPYDTVSTSNFRPCGSESTGIFRQEKCRGSGNS
ncbi:MAG: hypothetical protein Q4C96_04350 [Planctomycetia bacterium]|nr:hypothetical protein [Planctomycetia bacterium]